MPDLRSRLPAHGLMAKAVSLHPSESEHPWGDSESWYSGALGEILVGGILAQLPSGWTVLHSVPVGEKESDIDHVIIGPPGVFTLNTKAHPGRDVWARGRGLFVGGHSTAYIPKATREAADAARRLSEASGLTVPVTPLLVFVSPGRMSVTPPLDGDALVVRDDDLIATLTGRRRELSDEQVRRILTVATMSRTWTSRSLPDDHDRQSVIRFHALVARDLNRLAAEAREARAAAEAHGADIASPAARLKSVALRSSHRRDASPRSSTLRPPRPRNSSAPRGPGRRKPKRTLAGGLLEVAVVATGLWLLVAVLMPAALHALATPIDTAAPIAPDADGVVEHVVDGDTLDVMVSGQTHRVRILDVNAPASGTPGVAEGCLRPEAAAFLAQMVPAGTPVRLSFDAANLDEYGHVLASIALPDGRNVGVELARAGLAKAVQLGQNARFLADIEAASHEARDAQVGMYAPGSGCVM